MGKYSLTKKEPVISPENAHIQVMKLVERYNVDIDSMDEEKKEAYETTLDNVVKCIIDGRLEVFEENGETKVRQTIQNKGSDKSISELVYSEARGKDHIAMKRKGNEQAKMLSLLASMCEVSGMGSAVEKLRSSDLQAAEYLSLLFL